MVPMTVTRPTGSALTKMDRSLVNVSQVTSLRLMGRLVKVSVL